MRNFLNDLAYRLQDLMRGRNGSDDLNRFALIAVLILIILSFFLRDFPVLYALVELIIWGLTIYVLFRMFSKNLSARAKENRWFLNLKSGNGANREKRQRRREAHKKYGKTHNFFICPNCDHELMIPKKQGKVRITCPHCRTKFDAES